MSQTGPTGKNTGVYDPDNDFFFLLHNIAKISDLDLETWFKVTVHPLPKGTL